MKNLVFSFFVCIFGFSCSREVVNPQSYYYQNGEYVARIPFSNIGYQYEFMKQLKHTKGYDCNKQCTECQSDSLIFTTNNTRGLFVEIRKK